MSRSILNEITSLKILIRKWIRRAHVQPTMELILATEVEFNRIRISIRGFDLPFDQFGKEILYEKRYCEYMLNPTKENDKARRIALEMLTARYAAIDLLEACCHLIKKDVSGERDYKPWWDTRNTN